jgi:hypothetical protein
MTVTSNKTTSDAGGYLVYDFSDSPTFPGQSQGTVQLRGNGGAGAFILAALAAFSFFN